MRLVAHYLKKHKQLQYARDMYKKVGDFKAVVDQVVRETTEFER